MTSFITKSRFSQWTLFGLHSRTHQTDMPWLYFDKESFSRRRDKLETIPQSCIIALSKLTSTLSSLLMLCWIFPVWSCIRKCFNLIWLSFRCYEKHWTLRTCVFDLRVFWYRQVKHFTCCDPGYEWSSRPIASLTSPKLFPMNKTFLSLLYVWELDELSWYLCREVISRRNNNKNGNQIKVWWSRGMFSNHSLIIQAVRSGFRSC